RPAPPSPDYVLALPNKSPDSDLDSDPLEDVSPSEDVIETVESLHTLTVGLCSCYMDIYTAGNT
nr:hypothetical protein [Tanacetum cinerariifolium]